MVIQKSIRQISVALVLIASGNSLSSCATHRLTADSKCSDYIHSGQQTRYDAAIQITYDLQVQDAGNPMWELNLDSICGKNPNLLIRDVLGKSKSKKMGDDSTTGTNTNPEDTINQSHNMSPIPDITGQIGNSD